MKVKIIEYDIEQDTIEFQFSRGTDTFGRIVTFRSMQELINIAEGKSNKWSKLPDTVRELVEAIIERGGIDWIRDEIDQLTEL